MKTMGPLGMLVLGFLAVSAGANPPDTHGSKPSPPAGVNAAAPKSAMKRIVVRGEILDLGCFYERGLRGPIHRDCARQCLAQGVPMGLLAEDSTVYLLTQDHGRAMAPSQYQTPDAYAQCRQWPSETVEITGAAAEHDGAHLLEVLRARLVPAPATGGTPKTP